MWDRIILKQNAKVALGGGRYGRAFLVCLIDFLILGIFGGWSFSSRGSSALSPQAVFADAVAFHWYTIPNILLLIFAGFPLMVGIARFFLQNRFSDRAETVTMFTGFSDHYGNTVSGMLITSLITFVYSLLFIIPGIIKGLEYTMVPFILADNPAMPGERARQISSMMTNGEKGAIFTLYLSFLGWYIAIGVAFSVLSWVFWPIAGFLSTVGAAVVETYRQATFTELYIYMRDRIIHFGAASPAEFGLSL